jgi:hypothetical protein
MSVGLLQPVAPTTEQDRRGSPARTAASLQADDDTAIHWRTDRVDLRADGLTLRRGDRIFEPGATAVTITEDIQTLGQWHLRAAWTDDGHSHVLELNFRAKDTDWWVETVAWWTSGLTLPDGRRGFGGASFGGADATRTPLGRTFVGDLESSAQAWFSLCDASEMEEHLAVGPRAALSFEGLRLSVSPRERSLLDKALRLIGLDGLLDEPFTLIDEACSERTG